MNADERQGGNPGPSPALPGLVLWPAVGVVALAGLVRWGRLLRDDGPWRHRVDWPLTLVAGVLGATWLLKVNGPAWFTLFPLTSSDFGQYCAAIRSQQGTGLVAPATQRSIVAGALPMWLGHYTGLLTALAGGALVATAVFASAVFAAARVLHSRLAGGLAVGATCLFLPLVALPRTLSFYPELVAAGALAACAALAHVTYRTRVTALFAGLAAGLLAISDARGWLMLTPALAVSLAAALSPGKPSRWIRVVCVLAPLGASWWIAGRPGVMPAGTLPVQFAAYIGDALRSRGLEPLVPPPGPTERFSFGNSPAADLVPSVKYILRIGALTRGTEPSPETELARTFTSTLWAWCVPWLGLAAFALRRAPPRLLALTALVIPAVSGVAQAAALVPQPRQFLVPMLVGPIVIGVAAAGLLVDVGTPWVRLPAGLVDPPRQSGARRWLRGGLAFALVLGFALVFEFGNAGRPLASRAEWPSLVDTEPRTTWAALHGATPDDQTTDCLLMLKQERDAGHDPWPPWIERPGPKAMPPAR